MAIKDNTTSNLAPPDSGYGWVVALGGFIIFFLVGGQAYSFGVLYVEFLNAFGASKADTAWIGALSMGIGLLAYPLSLLLIKRYSYRTVTLVAGILSSVGIYATSFATSMTQVYVIYGVFASFWFWVPVLTTLGIVGKYFSKKLPFAVSLAISGTGAGQFTLAFVIQLLLDEYGWRGTLMILAALNLHVCVAGALYRPIELYHLKNVRRNTELQSHRQQPIPAHDVKKYIKSDTVSNSDYCSNKDCHSEELTPQEQSNQCDYVVENVHTGKSPAKCCHGSCMKLWTSCLATYDFALFKNAAFVLFLMCGFGSEGGSFAIITHIVKRGRDYGIPSLRSSSLPALMGITQFLGRIIWGLFGSFAHKIKPTILYGGSIAAAGVVTIISIHTTTYIGQLVYVVLLGICMACYIPIFPIVMRQIVGIKHFDSGNMFYLTAMSLASLLSVPFVGWIRDIKGNYDLAFYLIAVILLSSATCAFMAHVAEKYKVKKKEQQKLTNSTYKETENSEDGQEGQPGTTEHDNNVMIE
ncbi:monocarboxylate transporter 12-B-like isoform X2 [Glandiceps talaboti]